MTALTAEALRLPPEERLRLIEEVWDSLAAAQDTAPVTPAEMEELERRRKRYTSDPASLIDWHELKAQIRRRGHDS
jgi:putative addiction module component (TIGR02574 family)